MRYPLHLPVLVRMARKEMHARSENISLGGILLASNVLIPEGTIIEVVVGVEHLPDPGVLLSALGTVLRVQPKATGDFDLAVRLERSFELPFGRREAQRASSEPAMPVPDCGENRSAPYRSSIYRSAIHGAHPVVSWHTET